MKHNYLINYKTTTDNRYIVLISKYPIEEISKVYKEKNKEVVEICWVEELTEHERRIITYVQDLAKSLINIVQMSNSVIKDHIEMRKEVVEIFRNNGNN